MIVAYEAVDKEGKSRADTVEADTPEDAVEILRRRGLFVTQVSKEPETQGGTLPGKRPQRAARLPLKTLVLFTRQMSMLLRSGTGLVPSIMAVSRQMTNDRHKAVLEQVVADLEDGATLTDALKKHPRTFDPVYYSIIAAGEASATLDKMFDRLAVILGKRRAMRKKLAGTLAYPALLIAMCSHIILGLLWFVLPRFADMFVQLGVDIPASTKALLSLGTFIRAYWPALFASAAGILCGGWMGLRTPWGRQFISNVQIQIPLVGWIISRLIQGQILRTMGLLIESRVGLLETLDLVSKSTNNNRFRKLFQDLETSVTSGGQLSSAFEASGLVDPAMCQAVRTGEESGNLGEAMTYCADVLDESNEELVNMISKLIEPVILIGMGVVVGGVAISLFLPLFDLTSAIN